MKLKIIYYTININNILFLYYFFCPRKIEEIKMCVQVHY